jgi:hypothetical protein
MLVRLTAFNWISARSSSLKAPAVWTRSENNELELRRIFSTLLLFYFSQKTKLQVNGNEK